MAGEWTDGVLGDFIELKRGYDLSSNMRKVGSIPIISSGGQSGFHDVPMAKAPGVVTGRYGTIGKVFYVNEDYWPLNTTLYVSDFKGSNPRFVSYFLKTINFSAYSDKAAVPGINRNQLHEAVVSWPNSKRQNAIADLLGALDDRIDLNRKMAATLEEMAKTIFESWFINFEPVHAKSEGRSAGLRADIDALFPSQFDAEGVPVGWNIGTPETLVEINPSTPIDRTGIAPYVDMASLPTHGHRIKSNLMRPVSSGSRFQNGDTLLARITPCLENGKTALVDCLEDGQVAWGSTEFIVMRPRKGIPAALPYLIARDISFRSHMISSMSGTSGRQRAPSEAVSRWNMAIPPENLINAWGRAVTSMFDSITFHDIEIQQLSELRDILLPKLLSGELRLDDATDAVAAA